MWLATVFDWGSIAQFWSHSQEEYPLRKALAYGLLTMDADLKYNIHVGSREQVVLVYSTADGCCRRCRTFLAFGISQKNTLRVTMVPQRTDEHSWDPYGPAMITGVGGEP